MPEVTNLTAQFPKEKFNLILQSEIALSVSPLQQVSYEQIRISPNVPDGDVYLADGKKALTLVALVRFGNAANVKWDTNCGKIHTGDPMRIAHAARCGLQKPDGSWIMSPMVEIEVNLLDKFRQIEMEVEKKGRERKIGHYKKTGEKDSKGWDKSVFVAYEYGSQECRDEMARLIEKRQMDEKMYGPRKVESAAQSRALRKLLGIKPTYSDEELTKPFVIARIGPNYNYMMADPEMKQRLIQAAMAGIEGMFGEQHAPARLQSEKPVHALPAASVEDVERETLVEEVETVESAVEPEEKVVEQPKTKKNGKKKSKVNFEADEFAPELEAEVREYWAGKTVDDRVKRIGELIAAKKYTPKSKTLPGELSADKQVGYLWALTQYVKAPEKAVEAVNNSTVPVAEEGLVKPGTEKPAMDTPKDDNVAHSAPNEEIGGAK